MAYNPSKMAALKAINIETLILDVVSKELILAYVSKVIKLTKGTLNILLNNASA
jgi:hypothetical protein